MTDFDLAVKNFDTWERVQAHNIYCNRYGLGERIYCMDDINMEMEQWKDEHDFSDIVYAVTEGYFNPQEEYFSLTDDGVLVSFADDDRDNIDAYCGETYEELAEDMEAHPADYADIIESALYGVERE